MRLLWFMSSFADCFVVPTVLVRTTWFLTGVAVISPTHPHLFFYRGGKHGQCWSAGQLMLCARARVEIWCCSIHCESKEKGVRCVQGDAGLGLTKGYLWLGSLCWHWCGFLFLKEALAICTPLHCRVMEHMVFVFDSVCFDCGAADGRITRTVSTWIQGTVSTTPSQFLVWPTLRFVLCCWLTSDCKVKHFMTYCDTMTHGLDRVLFVHSSGHEVRRVSLIFIASGWGKRVLGDTRWY